MNDNPYSSPRTETNTTRSPQRGRRLFVVGVLCAGLAFGSLLLIGLFRPFGVFGAGPMTTARQVMAGVALLLNLTMYAGVLMALVGGVLWIRGR